ncbi:MAG: hypothetical protein AAGJ56_01430 [Myxococcota bacterium]
MALTAIAGLAAVVLLANTAIVGSAYILHRFFTRRLRGQPPAWARYIRAFVAEWCASLGARALYVFGLFGDGVHGRFDPTGGPPIVLVHGFFMNRSMFLLMAWRLRRRGFRNLYRLNVRPLIAPLSEQAQQLEQLLLRVSDAAGGLPMIGIGHSQGGILLRWLASKSTRAPLQRVFTIGSPHRGTEMARFGLGVNAAEMRPSSPSLEALGESTSVPLTAYYSELDHIIVPAESAAFGPDARLCADAGHNALLAQSSLVEDLARTLTDEHTPSELPRAQKPALNDLGMS